MTVILSIAGFVGRAAGRLLTTAIGWAGSLLFGRVPQSHQIFVSLLIAGSLLWVVCIVLSLIPGVTPVLLDTTPHPGFIGPSLIRSVVLAALLMLPPAVGVASYLAPAPEDRATGLAAVRQILMGYPIALLMTALLVFLAGLGIARKTANARRGWSDTHIPIVAKPDGYDRLVSDLRSALAGADLQVSQREAPRMLALPGKMLANLAGPHIQHLVPDRLIRLSGMNLSIDVHPSDIAISGRSRERMRARVAILSCVPWTSAHLTTSAEAQDVEDRLERVERDVHRTAAVGSTRHGLAKGELAEVDRILVDTEIPIDEWDILYRLRLQVERDLLAVESVRGQTRSVRVVSSAGSGPPTAAAGR